MLEFLFNAELLQTYGWRLVLGLGITLKVVGLSCTLGFVLAYPICRARMSRSRLLSGAALAYVTFFRGTPLLCQLYLVYYGGGELRGALTELGVWWFFRDAFYCCIFAFTLNTAAYQAEIMRGRVGRRADWPDRGCDRARPAPRGREPHRGLAPGRAGGDPADGQRAHHRDQGERGSRRS